METHNSLSRIASPRKFRKRTKTDSCSHYFSYRSPNLSLAQAQDKSWTPESKLFSFQGLWNLKNLEPDKFKTDYKSRACKLLALLRTAWRFASFKGIKPLSVK